MTAEQPVDAVPIPSETSVTIREVDQVPDLEQVSLLLSRVWNRTVSRRQITVSMLRALGMTGNYVGAAFAGGQIVGASVGFFAPDRGSLHSHITGVDPRSQAREVGLLLKRHQRTWALNRGIHSVTWTYDPLVRRNAYFNLGKLGARATLYLLDFYGPMHDGVNRGDESDRLLVEWDLLSPAAVAAAAGQPSVPVAVDHPSLITAGPDSISTTPWSGGSAFVPVPEDIEKLRGESPSLAQSWRIGVREVLDGAMSRGALIAGFDRQRGYLLSDPATPGLRSGTG